MKNLIIAIILTFSVACVTSAQKTSNDPSIPAGLYSPLDKFLIEDAKPPLRLSDVTRSAQTLAWVTGGTFTNEEYEEYKAAIIQEWKAENQETKNFIAGWIAQADKLATIKKYAEQIAFKERLLPDVIADMKNHPDDPKRSLMRRIYRRANGENSLGTFKVKPKVIKTTGILKDVLGDWLIQTGVGVNMKTLKLSILANGKAGFSDLRSVQKGNCFVTQTLAKDGAAEVSGGAITLSFSRVQLQGIDSCQPTIVKNEEQPGETHQFTWQLRSDENEMRQLCLTTSDGVTACYRKKD